MAYEDQPLPLQAPRAHAMTGVLDIQVKPQNICKISQLKSHELRSTQATSSPTPVPGRP